MSALPKVFIATPSADHRVHAGYAQSLLRVLHSRMFDVTVGHMANAGLTRARNIHAAEFLASDREYFFAVDSDITFTEVHFARLIAANLPIVCGLYALKDFDHIWCVERLNPCPPMDKEHGRLEVAKSGTGFMCVKREVFEAMIKAHPEIEYEEDIAADRGKVRWDFFSQGVVNRRYLTEDWFFCERARKLGFKVYVDTTFHVMHGGHAEYPLKPLVELEQLRSENFELKRRLAELSQPITALPLP